MTLISKRQFTLAGLTSVALLAGCANGVGSRGGDQIDARVDQTLNQMLEKYPGTADLVAKASGILVMPLVTEAGFIGLGGGFGRGALRIGDVTVDYYSAARGSFGIQLGAQQFSHVLFFMTEEALTDFRRSSGFALGADVEYALSDNGENVRADTVTSLSPVVAVIFGQAGLFAGATLEGTKYTRIIP